MSLPRTSQIIGAHADTVVGHCYTPKTAAFDIYLNRRGTGIHGIFNQLFHNRGWSFDHLSRRYLIDNVRFE
jgi:hypothetical protein